MSDAPRTVANDLWRKTRQTPAQALPVPLLLRLQRTVGNQEVQRLLAARTPAPVIEPLPVEPQRPSYAAHWLVAVMVFAGLGALFFLVDK
jgi:hypothetical protein